MSDEKEMSCVWMEKTNFKHVGYFVAVNMLEALEALQVSISLKITNIHFELYLEQKISKLFIAKMSTRFYPRFVKGNPQLRIFLPDWKMIMIKPAKNMPDNIVSFKVDPRMTDWDVRNYLEKIYKVQVGAVKSRIFAGKLKRVATGLAKGDDYKIANVTLALGQSFNWPDLFPEEKLEDTKKDYEFTLKELEKNRKKDPNVQDVPSWFV